MAENFVERCHYLMRGGHFQATQEILQELSGGERKRLVETRLQGVTALSCAVAYHKPSFYETRVDTGDRFLAFIRYLMEECSADLEQKSVIKYDMPDVGNHHFEMSPLTLAIIKADNVEISQCYDTYQNLIQLFLEKGARLQEREIQNRTKLMFVRRSGRLCEFLINRVKLEQEGREIELQEGNLTENEKSESTTQERGAAYVRSIDDSGFTALHFTSSKEVCDILLSHGAQIDAQDKYGCTPLVTAIVGTKYDAIQNQENCTVEKLFLSISEEKEKLEAYELLAANLFTFQAHDVCNHRNFTIMDDIPFISEGIRHVRARYLLCKVYNRDDKGTSENDRRHLYGDCAVEETLRNKFLEGNNLDVQQCLILGILIQERILGEDHPRTLFSLFLLFVISALPLNKPCMLNLQQHFQVYKKVYGHALRQNVHFDLNIEDSLGFEYMYDNFFKHWVNEPGIRKDIPDMIADLTFYFRTYHFPGAQNSTSKVHVYTYIRFVVLWLFGYCHVTGEVEGEEVKNHVIISKLNMLKRVLGTLSLEYLFLQIALDQALFHGRKKSGNTEESEGLKLMELLYSSGFSPNARSSSGETQLNFYSRLAFLHTGHKGDRASFCVLLLDVMLKHGLHADLIDEKGRTVVEILQSKLDISEVKECSLKCLASRVIVRQGIDYRGQVPQSLHEFIEYHRNLSKK